MAARAGGTRALGRRGTACSVTPAHRPPLTPTWLAAATTASARASREAPPDSVPSGDRAACRDAWECYAEGGLSSLAEAAGFVFCDEQATVHGGLGGAACDGLGGAACDDTLRAEPGWPSPESGLPPLAPPHCRRPRSALKRTADGDDSADGTAKRAAACGEKGAAVSPSLAGRAGSRARYLAGGSAAAVAASRAAAAAAPLRALVHSAAVLRNRPAVAEIRRRLLAAVAVLEAGMERRAAEAEAEAEAAEAAARSNDSGAQPAPACWS